MQKKSTNSLEIIMSLIAIAISISIFLKATFDMDTNYDVGWYHLPFAARIWGIVPKESFLSVERIEDRYDGFPLLAHFFQGLLWKLTGRIEATHLVGYFSVIIYFLFLRSYLKIPLYISTIAIFTIPVVLTHAPSGFVDLPGNIGASVLVVMTYCFFRQSQLPSKKELLFTFLGAAVAVNTKPQLQPLVFVIYWMVVIRLLWLYFRYTAVGKRHLWLTIPLTVIASIAIFATPIKNVALYGNPFYPTKIEVAGIVLNHRATPQTYNEGNRPQKWLKSILEINTPEWSIEQSNRTNEPKYLDRAGGFFGAYVLFNLLLLVVLTIDEKLRNKRLGKNQTRNASTALIGILSVSLIPANFPQSHELRYFAFWMITLVSFNLYIVFSHQNRVIRWFKIKYLKLAYLCFFIVMCIKIQNFYLKPDFRTLEVYLPQVINQKILQQIVPNQQNCLVGRYSSNPRESPFPTINHAFYYSSYFHPKIANQYGIKIVKDSSDCENTNIIPRKN